MCELEVTKIDNLTSFKEIRGEWELIYQCDPNAQIFISWIWLFNLLSTTSAEWIVLGLNHAPNSKYVGFFPIQINRHGFRGVLQIREIVFLGKPHSIYPGFLCLPEFEDKAINTLGAYLQSDLKWDVMHLNWILDPRIDKLLDTFDKTSFIIKSGSGEKALRIRLPGSFQEYLNNYFGSTSRRMIRRRTKYIQTNNNFKITYSASNSFETDIYALCNLWNNRWQRKAESDWNKETLKQYFNSGLLRLNVLWDNEKPVSALACLLDPKKKTWYAFITSYDPEYSKIAPGIVLFSDSIKKSIEESYDYFDFTVGDDTYKQLFSPEKFETRNVSIKRKSFNTSVLINLGKRIKGLMN